VEKAPQVGGGRLVGLLDGTDVRAAVKLGDRAVVASRSVKARGERSFSLGFDDRRTGGGLLTLYYA